MKGLICECRNAIRLTATAGVSAIFAGADVAARATAPNVMRKVLDIKNVSNTSYGTIGKTKPVVALLTRVLALTDTIAEYSKAIGLSRKTKRLWDSVSGLGSAVRQRTLSMRSVNAPQILGKQYSPLRELPQPAFQRLSSQLYVVSLVWGQRVYVAWRAHEGASVYAGSSRVCSVDECTEGWLLQWFFRIVLCLSRDSQCSGRCASFKAFCTVSSAAADSWYRMDFLPHLSASTRIGAASVGGACAAWLSGRAAIRCMRYLSAAPGVSGGNTRDVSGGRQGGNSRFLCLSFLSDLRGVA